MSRMIMGETWIDPEERAYDRPLAKSPRRGLVRCSDGRLRTARLGVPDTFFSIPARLSAMGKTITGFVHLSDDEFRFCACAKNKHLIEGGK